MAEAGKERTRLAPAFWIMVLVLLVLAFYAGIRLGGLNVPLQRIPWSVLVPVCAVFSMAHSTVMLGWRRAGVLLVLCLTVSFAAEYVGESTGLIFGPYEYTNLLGLKLFDRIPVLIPFAWYMMFYPSYVVTNVLGEGSLVARRTDFGWIVWMSVLSALVMTAWDVTMDPVMSFNLCAGQPGCQLPTELNQAVVGHPAWIWRDGGPHFGVPLENFRGWLLTAFVVFLAYRLLQLRIPHRPIEGHASRFIAFMPVGVYGLMALIDTWLGYPQIEDVRLISPFVMGIPFIFASFRLFAEHTHLPWLPQRQAA